MRNPISRFCATLLVFGFLAMGARPAGAADSDLQQWTLLVVQGDLSNRWRGYFELQPRIGRDADGLERLLVRPAFGYKLRPNVSLWLGYGYTPLFEPEFSPEHRIFQQFLTEHRIGDLDITNRARLEQRFIDGVGETSHRFRHMLRLAHPLDRKKKWSIIAFDELFWNLNSTRAGPESGFDQNRVFLGVGRVINPQLRVEAGYLWNFIDAPSGRPNRSLDVILISLFHTW